MNDATVTGTVGGTVPGTVSVHRDATPAPTTTPSPTPFASSRTDAQRGPRLVEESVTSRIRRISGADALARIVGEIRPDWPLADIHAWALRDERPWADVVAAGINGARDRSIRQVGGLQFAGPVGPSTAPQLPTVAEALNPDLDDHGFRVGACPVCRRGGAS